MSCVIERIQKKTADYPDHVVIVDQGENNNFPYRELELYSKRITAKLFFNLSLSLICILFAAIIVIMHIYLCFSNLSNCSSSGSVTPFLYVYPIFR